MSRNTLESAMEIQALLEEGNSLEQTAARIGKTEEECKAIYHQARKQAPSLFPKPRPRSQPRTRTPTPPKTLPPLPESVSKKLKRPKKSKTRKATRSPRTPRPSRSPRWSDELLVKVWEERSRGEKWKDLAKRHGFGGATHIRNEVKKRRADKPELFAHIPELLRESAESKYPDELLARVWKQKNQGLTWEEAGKRNGIATRDRTRDAVRGRMKKKPELFRQHPN